MRNALIAFAAGIVVLGGLVVVPFLTEKRDFPAHVMVPWPGIGGPVHGLAPGSELCIQGLTAERHGGVARFAVRPDGRVGPALGLRLEGRGYQAEGRLAGGYDSAGFYDLRFEPPPRDTLVTACVRNLGGARAGLYAYPGRLRSRPKAFRDGEELAVPPIVSLREAQERRVANRLPLVVERLARSRGPLGHEWIVWAALVFFVVGLIGGVGVAIAAATRGPRGSAGETVADRS